MAISASKLIHGSHHPYLTAPKPISIAHIKLVSEFAVFDRWFASVPSSTQPNRLYVHSATSHGATSNIPSLLVMENRRRRLAAAEAFASSPSSDHHNQQTHEDAPPPRVMGSWVSSHGCREKVESHWRPELPTYGGQAFNVPFSGCVQWQLQTPPPLMLVYKTAMLAALPGTQPRLATVEAAQHPPPRPVGFRACPVLR
ncbi:hypothetical protein RJ640_015401 [Escallonia rubra]|uniref:Uncharacterized protein n=1 Tax=Escallonia rubra TaxID=112253 RepID=A0AA88U7S4_9ASTE|nr:hypothetical protein RJ640_015401 [Escallonia rubra]